jgi:polar amino acid transport system substrate-binding protein
MIKFITRTFLLYFIVLSQLKAFQPASSIENITFYTEDYPPANFVSNNELIGISVETLKALWKHLNIPEQTIHVVPWSSGYQYTLDNNNTALFTMSKTPSRENLFKWVGPIFHSTYVLMAKKSKNLTFENLGQIFKHQIVTVQGDISEISLYQVGFPTSNMAKVSQFKQAFLMMELDRVDMMVITPHAFSYLAEQLDFDINDYEQVWQISKVGNFLAFNLNTSDKVIKKYQEAFDQIANQRLSIKESYNLPFADY